MDRHKLNQLRTQDFSTHKRATSPSQRLRQRFHPPTRWLRFAQELLRLPTAPFHEQNVMLWVWQFAKNRGLPVRIDDAGNVIVEFIPDEPAGEQKRLMFTAHMDHIGFWAVQHTSHNLLRAHWMGRYPEDLFVGSRVVFWTGGKPLDQIEPGLTQANSVSGQLRIGGKRVSAVVERVVSFNEAGDVAEVDLKTDERVEPGSIGMWDLGEPITFNGRMSATAVDDLAGVAALVCLMDSLNRENLQRPVTCLFTRCEEGGFFGAIRYCRENFDDRIEEQTTGHRLVSVETSKALPLAPLGSGPIVRVGDRSSVFHPGIVAWAQQCAEELAKANNDFSYQRRLMDGGTCESSVFQAWTGKAGAVCIPLDNYHNYSRETDRMEQEVVDVSDWGNLVRLMIAMTEKIEQMGDTDDEFREWCIDWENKHRAMYNQSDQPGPIG
ncbi:M20/M25/M40 family metallo-hydrolase [Mucisphaera sp.]|uniref:M20/M25/M40 family metallo-hydrolase n=1 Tax=Mucisphaera sp. TaxID=2913024 RepID=UPI003D12F9B0